MIDRNATEFLDFCRNFDHAMLVTQGKSGLIARPMMIAEVDALGNFWFATDVTSGKVVDIQNNQDVCITMTDVRINLESGDFFDVGLITALGKSLRRGSVQLVGQKPVQVGNKRGNRNSNKNRNTPN